MKYVNQLTDAELTSVYKSFMGPEDKFVDLTITRNEKEIILEGHIKIPEDDKDYADEYGYCEIDESYAVTDYTVKSFNHSGNMNLRFRTYLFNKFGIHYALDFLYTNI